MWLFDRTRRPHALRALPALGSTSWYQRHPGPHNKQKAAVEEFWRSYLAFHAVDPFHDDPYSPPRPVASWLALRDGLSEDALKVLSVIVFEYLHRCTRTAHPAQY